MKKILFFLGITLLYAMQFTVVVIAAPKATLRQRIFPLNCIFDYVNDGTNTIYYITPDICEPPTNPIIPQNPEPTIVVTETTTDTSSPTPTYFYNRPTISTTEQQSGIIYLNRYDAYKAIEGITLTVSMKQLLYFDVISVDGIQRHSITIEEIADSYVVLSIASERFKARMNEGEMKEFDVTADGKPDIRITVNSTANNSAELTFKSLDQSIPLSAELVPVEESSVNIWQVVSAALPFIAASLIMYRVWRVKRIGR